MIIGDWCPSYLERLQHKYEKGKISEENTIKLKNLFNERYITSTKFIKTMKRCQQKIKRNIERRLKI